MRVGAHTRPSACAGIPLPGRARTRILIAGRVLSFVGAVGCSQPHQCGDTPIWVVRGVQSHPAPRANPRSHPTYLRRCPT
ncbi:hypothetical protein ACFPRL_07095 [Pseudoclavibacter helvolus]